MLLSPSPAGSGRTCPPGCGSPARLWLAFVLCCFFSNTLPLVGRYWAFTPEAGPLSQGLVKLHGCARPRLALGRHQPLRRQFSLIRSPALADLRHAAPQRELWRGRAGGPPQTVTVPPASVALRLTKFKSHRRSHPDEKLQPVFLHVNRTRHRRSPLATVPARVGGLATRTESGCEYSGVTLYAGSGFTAGVQVKF